MESPWLAGEVIHWPHSSVGLNHEI
jgi:hypothetical protein